TFSLNESIHNFRRHGKKIDTVVSIGGAAKNEDWLQIQADIFNAKVVKLSSEQGPGMGAAMLAAYGCNWFSTLQECADQFLNIESYLMFIDKYMMTLQVLIESYLTIVIKLLKGR